MRGTDGFLEPVDNQISELLNDASAFPASVNPSVASYLHDLLINSGVKHAVEVGCCRGFSTLHLAKALRCTGGRLISFDLSTSEAGQRIFRAGLEDVVEFVVGNSAVEGQKFFRSKEQCLDFLFIDGDHTCRGVLRDIKAFLPHLKIGGMLVLHDIFPERCGWNGPRYFLDLLANAKRKDGTAVFEIEEICHLDSYGIAVCRKNCEFPEGMIQQWDRMAFRTSRLAQFFEIAAFEGVNSPLKFLIWGLSKRRHILRHW